ncbi:MAG: GC-type dockerin domain-anchored protein [Planctomycetota bacterium]
MRQFTLTAVSSAAAVSAACGTVSAQDIVSFEVSGTDADGYLATVALNQEGNQTLDNIDRNPLNEKFFDYPAYVNPNIPTNIWIMYVEPYRFGLNYPDPLHSNGFEDFQSVGELRPASEAGLPGVTFIEAVTEDADFAETDIGDIEFDASVLTGVGTEFIPASDVTLLLDGTEFQSTNRSEIIPGADIGPFGPAGRSNRNEAANVVEFEILDQTGTGLTFEDGVLTSIDLVVDVELASTLAAFVQIQDSLFAEGTLTFSGSTFAFDIDGQDGVFVASDVRLILNRTATIDAVGTFSIGTDCPCDVNDDTFCNGSDFFAWVSAFGGQAPECDVNGDTFCNGSDFFAWVSAFGQGCP